MRFTVFSEPMKQISRAVELFNFNMMLEVFNYNLFGCTEFFMFESDN